MPPRIDQPPSAAQRWVVPEIEKQQADEGDVAGSRAAEDHADHGRHAEDDQPDARPARGHRRIQGEDKGDDADRQGAQGIGVRPQRRAAVQAHDPLVVPEHAFVEKADEPFAGDLEKREQEHGGEEFQVAGGADEDEDEPADGRQLEDTSAQRSRRR